MNPAPGTSSAEQTSDGVTFRTFTGLPIGLADHCLVALNGAERGDFFLTGGYSGGSSKKTYIYNSGWMPKADMPTARSGKKPNLGIQMMRMTIECCAGLACGAVRSRAGGPVEKVVAAGGRNGNYPNRNYLSKVEVYDVANNTWTEGNNKREISYELKFMSELECAA